MNANSMTLAKSKEQCCPRCSSTFTCKVDELKHCGCAQLHISDETRIFLSKTHLDCLCTNCLEHYDHLTDIAQPLSFPTQSEQLIEGLHYYKENGYWVFTELYHFLRGHCCKSGCRHCVYGYK